MYFVWLNHTSYLADDAVSKDLGPSERPNLVLPDMDSQLGLPKHNAKCQDTGSPSD